MVAHAIKVVDLLLSPNPCLIILMADIDAVTLCMHDMQSCDSAH
jgi:hypothetical protein